MSEVLDKSRDVVDFPVLTENEKSRAIFYK